MGRAKWHPVINWFRSEHPLIQIQGGTCFPMVLGIVLCDEHKATLELPDVMGEEGQERNLRPVVRRRT